jgi:hypothetical protein
VARDLDAVSRGDFQFPFSDRPSAEPAHPAQPRADGGGLGGLGRPRGDRAPGRFVEHRLPAAVGQPAGSSWALWL